MKKSVVYIFSYLVILKKKFHMSYCINIITRVKQWSKVQSYFTSFLFYIRIVIFYFSNELDIFFFNTSCYKYYMRIKIKMVKWLSSIYIQYLVCDNPFKFKYQRFTKVDRWVLSVLYLFSIGE